MVMTHDLGDYGQIYSKAATFKISPDGKTSLVLLQYTYFCLFLHFICGENMFGLILMIFTLRKLPTKW